MKATLVVNGKFHHFHLARELVKYGLLQKIYTSYPDFKLKEESGVPSDLISSYSTYYSFYSLMLRLGIARFPSVSINLAKLCQRKLDDYVAVNTSIPTIMIGLSGCATRAGKANQLIGGKFICDRGSTHITYQNEILEEESMRFGIPYRKMTSHDVARELEDYASADVITIPSNHCKQTFIQKGINPDKLKVIPYGSNVARFRKVADPVKDEFTLLWVGAVSVRKGFIYALDAFHKLKHSKKSFIVIGSLEPLMEKLLAERNTHNVQFLGKIPNAELAFHYSRSHAFVLSSIEEGLAMVQGEALACGCPVIATEHCGAPDLFKHGSGGFIVPIRSSDAIAAHLQSLADDESYRLEQSEAAMRCVSAIGGWDEYGNKWKSLIHSIV